MRKTQNALIQRRSLILRTVYALSLIGATYNHWVAIYQHGFGWDYGGFTLASSTFWTALAFIDPAIVILLFARPNTGIVATAAVIVVDVTHNVSVQAYYFPPLLSSLMKSPLLLEQIGFMIFVMITAPVAWETRRRAT